MFKECDKDLLRKGHLGQKKDILAFMENRVYLRNKVLHKNYTVNNNKKF